MLEFLVLGLVPGTHIQLTFENVLSISAVAFMAYLLFIYGKRILTPIGSELRFFLIYCTLKYKI